MRRRDELIERFRVDEERLRTLEHEATTLRAELEAIKEELHALDEAPQRRLPINATPARAAPAPATSGAKVALFRSLFRGRTDVFPKYWENAKTQKKGYSPACSNEWVPGVCEKPRVKCGECSRQAFVAVDDRRVLEHLQGQHVMGVYPMLAGDLCWFIAADFDKKDWQSDVLAFAETCDQFDLPVAIERSRSGNGAHAWLFFDERVAANAARRMGCFLLTETMGRRHQLRMDSYDRLFPNQDTMPKGGFGNLIALPLQKKAREHGNTLFLDRSLNPYPDQWAYLATLPRISTERVERLADEATRKGRVIGVRTSPTGDEDEVTPWTRPPSGRPKQERVHGPLPKAVTAVISQRLFVPKVGLPSPLLNQVKRIAAFQNPEFYKKQSMRLSTAMTPRVISCAEDFPEHIALPRGCVDEVRELFHEHGIELTIQDERAAGKPIDIGFRGDLTPTQSAAVKAILDHDVGVFVAPPGTGKTVVGAYLTAMRKTNTLVLVHRKPLLDQWAMQLAVFLGVDPSSIGRLGGGKDKPNGKLDVAMIQSMARQGAVRDIIAEYGHVIVDECHHLPAVSFERVLAEVKARYVTGLTATPYRRDGHQPIIHMQCGPIRFVVDGKSAGTARPFDHRLLYRATAFAGAPGAEAIQDHYAALVADDARNAMILDDIERALVDGRSPIVLTERRDHLEYLASKLAPRVRHLVVLFGGRRAKDERLALSHLASIPDDEERVVLATGRYIGEGFDDARLDTLFLAMPVAWKGTMVQYAGRLHRFHRSKFEVCIYDYVDARVPMLARMFDKRLRAYRAMGYQIDGMTDRVVDDDSDEEENE